MVSSRRSFLRGAGLALFAGASPALVNPAVANFASKPARSLAFDNLHTGEKLKVEYSVFHLGDTPKKARADFEASKRKTKKDRAAPIERLVVEPISVAHPDSLHQERRMVVHEPASTEAPEAEDIPAVDPIAAEDIGHDDQ